MAIIDCRRHDDAGYSVKNRYQSKYGRSDPPRN